jgi:hypothetical protein
MQYSLIAGFAPPRSRVEGFTWLSTTAGAGGALGSVLAGPMITLFQRPYLGFVLAAGCALAAAVAVASIPTQRATGLPRARSG